MLSKGFGFPMREVRLIAGFENASDKIFNHYLSNLLHWGGMKPNGNSRVFFVAANHFIPEAFNGRTRLPLLLAVINH
jgi:hypothetical protein